MKILKLHSENVKRLKVVEITANGQNVLIGGRNEQGKTTVLDSIIYAIAGKRAIPSKPLRKGATEGKIVLELEPAPDRQIHGKLTIERTFSENGKTALEIRTEDGYVAPSPQSILNDLCGRISFDPWKFSRMKPEEQTETLREVVGLDFAELDSDRKRIYDQRTEINRDGVRLKAKLEDMPHYADAPAEEVSVAELVAEQKRREKVNRANREAVGTLAAMEAERDHTRDECEELDRKIADLMKQLAEKREQLQTLEQTIAQHKTTVETLEDADVEEIRRQIVEASEINLKVHANAARSVALKELDELREASQQLTEQIKEIDERKQQFLAEAKWPVPGLGISDNGEVLFEGIPFDQCSKAQRLRISAAMGMALNPTLRVMLIDDGESLDAEHLRILEEMAAENDFQLWISTVTNGPEDEARCKVVIEDGQCRPAPVAVGVGQESE